jgi:SAM-dependent methyltransferase
MSFREMSSRNAEIKWASAHYSGRMATITPQHGPSFPSEPHQAREVAESFGGEAERYDRCRPTYPNAMVDAVIAASPGRDFLDVGTGTGISARPFQQQGCRVLGVEPDERMAERARHRGLAVEVAKFEEWDPAGRTFDVVVAGQAWHWVDPVLGASKAAAVLRPGGRIALFWNVMSFPPNFAEAVSAVYREVVPGFPFFQSGASGGVGSYAPLLDKAINGIRHTGAFDEATQWQFAWDQRYTRDEWLEQVPTFGGHSQVPAEKLAELLTGIGDVIDAEGGTLTMGYTAVVITSTRTSAGRGFPGGHGAHVDE